MRPVMLAIGGLLLLVACESKADKYIRLNRELRALETQDLVFRMRNDSLQSVIERARVTQGMEADALRAMKVKDSLLGAAIMLGTKRERVEAELAVLR